MKLPPKHLGMLELFFGIIFLGLTIWLVIFAIDYSNKAACYVARTYDIAARLGNNINIPDYPKDVCMISTGEMTDTATNQSIDKITSMQYNSEILSLGGISYGQAVTAIPIFMIGALCALALSFIMIFQGLYHWNKK